MLNIKYGIVLILSTLLPGCASIELPDFKAHITLPASGDGYYVKTVSDDEGRIPKEKWEELRKRGIVILSDDWAILRFTVLKNCSKVECKDFVGMFDDLFDKLNEGAKKVPKKF